MNAQSANFADFRADYEAGRARLLWHRDVADLETPVAAFLKRQLATANCNYCVAQLAFGDQTLAELETSVGLFASEVMPALRGFDALADAA